jgi:hypothetical protein
MHPISEQFQDMYRTAKFGSITPQERERPGEEALHRHTPFSYMTNLRVTSKIVLILPVGTVCDERANQSSGIAVGSDEHNSRNDGKN